VLGGGGQEGLFEREVMSLEVTAGGILQRYSYMHGEHRGKDFQTFGDATGKLRTPNAVRKN